MIKNVLACLVFEEDSVVWDMVANLRYLDPSSVVLIYNNSGNSNFLKENPYRRDPQVIICPVLPEKKLIYGVFHLFMIDCMRWSLKNLDFDTITNVDSDQLLLRSGYSEALTRVLSEHKNFGMLSSPPSTYSWPNNLPYDPTQVSFPEETAAKELPRWLPFLSRWQGGVGHYPKFSFWPATCFGRSAARGIVKLYDEDAALREAMKKSKIFATEEVILPTLVSLMGYEIVQSPFCFDSIRFRARFTIDDLSRFLKNPDNIWMHSVNRKINDPMRTRIRLAHGKYETGKKNDLS